MIGADTVLNPQPVFTPSLFRNWGSAGIDEPKENSSDDDEFYKTLYSSALLENFETDLASECTTAVIRTKKDINVMISPMLLEALEKLVIM